MISLTREQAQFVAKTLRGRADAISTDSVREQYTALAADIELQIKRQRSFDDLTGSEKMEWKRAEEYPPIPDSFRRSMAQAEAGQIVPLYRELATPTLAGPVP